MWKPHTHQQIKHPLFEPIRTELFYARDVSKPHKIRRSPDLEALEMWKGLSGWATHPIDSLTIFDPRILYNSWTSCDWFWSPNLWKGRSGTTSWTGFALRYRWADLNWGENNKSQEFWKLSEIMLDLALSKNIDIRSTVCCVELIMVN